jgi:hypothetical protein
MVILDGMTRYIEAEKHGIKLKYVGANFDDRQEAMQFTRHVQLSRRNLTPSQYAALYAEYNTNRTQGGDRRSAEFQDKKSNLENEQPYKPNPPMLAAANKVVASGSTKLREAVRAGEVSATDAATVVGLPKTDQDAALRKVLDGKAGTLREATAKQRRSKPKPRKPGSETVSAKTRKNLRDLFGKLLRALDAAGIEADKEMDSILQKIKAA